MYFLGVDEAGYGPNLGPLVIGASLWRIPSGAPPADWYAALAQGVSPAPTRDGRTAIADSKRLYSSGDSLAQLERGVLAALALRGEVPRDWRGLRAALEPAGGSLAPAGGDWPERGAQDPPVPRAVELGEIAESAGGLGAALRGAGIEFHGLFARLVFPAEWNDLLDRLGNKAHALSHTTLALVADLLPRAPGPLHVVCDKHGGRSRYAGLLQQFFPEFLVEVRREGAEESSYAWGSPERRVAISFRRGGEAFLPAALASMAAKYLRELAMEAFNGYWRSEVSGLRPTAGYPVDAARFRREIAAAQARLGIDDRLLWRNR